MRRAAIGGLLGIAGLFAVRAAEAQFVQLARCQAALPCAFAWGVQYNPDPLLAGQYGNVPTTAVSGRIDPAHPFKAPALDLSKELDRQDFASQAARLFVLAHPAPARKAPETKQAESGSPAK